MNFITVVTKFVQDDRLQRCLAILSVEPMLLLPGDKSQH